MIIKFSFCSTAGSFGSLRCFRDTLQVINAIQAPILSAQHIDGGQVMATLGICS